jgi:hypothetical protein
MNTDPHKPAIPNDKQEYNFNSSSLAGKEEKYAIPKSTPVLPKRISAGKRKDRMLNFRPSSFKEEK